MKQIPIFDFTDLPQNSVSRQVTAVEQLGILCGLNRRTSRRLAKTVFLITSSFALETFVENLVSFIPTDIGWSLQFLFSTNPSPSQPRSQAQAFSSLRRAGERLESFEIAGNHEEGIEIRFSQSLAIGFEVPKSRELKQWARIIYDGDWEEAFTQLNRIYLSSRSKVQQLRDGISIQREVLESNKGQADAILSLVASKTDNPVIILNQHGNIEWVNSAFYQITGVDAQQIAKPNVVEVLFPHSDDLSSREAFQQSLKKERSFSIEYCWRNEPDNEIPQDNRVAWIEFQVTPIRDEDDILVRWIAIGANVTQRRQAELAMKAARDLAESASRGKTEFLAMMSHEIRTPMNAILGMTELTLGSELTIEQRAYLTTANNSAQALLAILNDILDLSKVEADRLELESADFNLADLVRDTLDTMAFLAQKKGLVLDCRFPITLPQQLIGDPARLRQILVNLVGNSIKFTNSGEVVVEAELTDETDDVATLHFSVRDTGVGIHENKISRIFEAFYQTDASVSRNYGGTGLGLSITSELVRLMGGRIWVESVLGKGSNFHFVVTLAKSTRPSITQELTAEFALPKPTVATASSESADREFISRWSRQLGFQDAAFPTAVELTQWVSGQSEPSEVVVIVDRDLPDQNGFSLAEHLRSRYGAKTIVCFAAGQRPESIKQCREMGIEHFLVKPISPNSLSTALKSVADSSLLKTGNNNQSRRVARVKIEPVETPLHVLVVDDYPSNRVLIAEVLRRRGHRWQEAANGHEAVERIKSADFDVVLMDVQMPDLDGMETTLRIRELPSRKSQVPVIATTAYVTEEDRQRCLAAGMDDYLAKPIDILELIEKTERWANTLRNPEFSTDNSNGFDDQLLIHDIPEWATNIAQTVIIERESESADAYTTDAHADSVGVFEFASALTRFAGDRQLLKMQMGFFLQETPQLLANIQQAIANKDTRSLVTNAHRLKAFIRSYDDELGGELAAKLEEMGRNKTTEGAPAVFSLLESCVNDLSRKIEVNLSW